MAPPRGGSATRPTARPASAHKPTIPRNAGPCCNPRVRSPSYSASGSRSSSPARTSGRSSSATGRASPRTRTSQPSPTACASVACPSRTATCTRTPPSRGTSTGAANVTDARPPPTAARSISTDAAAGSTVADATAWSPSQGTPCADSSRSWNTSAPADIRNAARSADARPRR